MRASFAEALNDYATHRRGNDELKKDGADYTEKLDADFKNLLAQLSSYQRWSITLLSIISDEYRILQSSSNV